MAFEGGRFANLIYTRQYAVDVIKCICGVLFFYTMQQEPKMWRTLIYYKPEYIDLAKKLQENYIAHQKDADIISEEEQDDVEYARVNQYDEAIFIEDANMVIMHDIKSFYTNRCPVSDVYYQ